MEEMPNAGPKRASFWQALVFFGLPFILLYRGVDYIHFRMITAKVCLRYPWKIYLPMDVLVMFFVSLLWYGYRRALLKAEQPRQGGRRLGRFRLWLL